MSVAAVRGLKWAALALMLGFAALQVTLNFNDPARALVAVAGALGGLLGIAASERLARAPAAPPLPPEPHLRDAMDGALKDIGNYIGFNQVYRAHLDGIDAALGEAADPARVREAVGELRAANGQIVEKTHRLGQALEATRREIARLRETVEEVERLSLIDPLTEVGNRRFFDRALREDMAACASSGAELCLALAEVDGLKSVRSRFGEVVADHLLKHFARTLAQGANGRGKTARHGEQVFVILFPGAPFSEAKRMVETLRRDLEAKRWVFGPKEQPLGVVTASFGLVKLAPGETAESVFHRAEARLARARQAGRNIVVADDGAANASAAARAT